MKKDLSDTWILTTAADPQSQFDRAFLAELMMHWYPDSEKVVIAGNRIRTSLPDPNGWPLRSENGFQ